MSSVNVIFKTNLISFCIFTFHFANPQFIYVDIYSVCHYSVSGIIVEFQNNTRVLTYGSLEVYYNLCNSLTNLNGCDQSAMVCVKKKNTPYIQNAGKKFVQIYGDKLIAVGTTCKDVNYKTSITFDLHLESKEMLHINGCEINISINPTPNCTINIGGLNLDLSPMSSLGDISVQSESEVFSLAICNYSSQCGEPYSGCILKAEKNFNFSTFYKQWIDYDYSNNKLIVKEKNYGKKTSSIYINCNWFVDLGKTEKLQKKYDFGIESKYGCVKLPTNCSVIKDDRYLYNISKLNRPNGWNITVPEGKLTINVCGPLNQYEITECSKIYSQVCLETNGSHIGLGSLSNSLQALEHELQMNILYGSKCPNDSSILLKTKIKFECSKRENGPKFLSITEECVYNILWQTPEACPIDMEKLKFDFDGENTKLKAIDCRQGSFDLNPLVLNTDNYRVLDDSGNIFYINLCRPLVINEDTFGCRGRAACKININDFNEETKYSAFGSAKFPQRDNNSLVLNYEGGWWQGSAHELQIKFVCGKENENNIIFHKNTDSKTEFIWKTAHVCKKTLQECRKIFNIDKITTTQILVKAATFEYKFSLCDSEYSVTTLDTGEVFRHVANTSLIFSKCKYTLKYELTSPSNVCDNPKRLNVVYLDFACNNRTVDSYEKESVDNCVLQMKFWTAQACNVFKDIDYNECEETTTQFKTIAQPNTRNCSRNFNDMDSLDLNLLTPFKVTSKTGTVYEIANKTSTCGDFICRNGKVAGTTCPSLVNNVLSRNIQMSFIGSKCDKEMYNTTLTYKCKETPNDLPKILSESNCDASIEVPDDMVCKKLQSNVTPEKGTSGGVIAGIVILCIVLVTVSGVLLWQYLKRHNYNTLDKSRVYIRNLNL